MTRADSAASETSKAPGAGGKSFVHPGLLHTEADFQRMKDKVQAGDEPWASGWEQLIKSPMAQSTWKPGPRETIARGGPGANVASLYRDVHAAYQCAVRWKVSGDEVYARKAVEILNAWSAVLKLVTGNNDRFLASGIYGYQFANAAEIMRSYPGWKPAELQRFQSMMLTVFYAMNHDFLVHHNQAAITNYYANWDLCNMASMLAIGVLCDRRDIYDEAVAYFHHGAGNGAMDKAVYYLHPGFLGQWQESGRDQGHTIMGIGLAGAICEMSWNQGDDLYSYHNNRLLSGAEYVARYNLGLDVPYQPYAWGVGPKGKPSVAPVVAPAVRGQLRPVWELIYHHYVNRRGLAAPYTSRMLEAVRPEAGGASHGSTYDQLGFGTLTFARDPMIGSGRPSSLQVVKRGQAVSLSWWGTAQAQTYQVGRAPQAEGPFTIIASGIAETLTFTDEDPPLGKGWYRVTGVQSDGHETPASAAVSVSTQPMRVVHDAFDSADVPTMAGVIHGGAIVPGKVGQALDLDGRDDYAALSSHVLGKLSDFTICAWVNLRKSDAEARIFDSGGTPGASLYLAAKGAKGVKFGMASVYQYNEETIEGTEALPTHQWVHVAVTLSDTVGTLYVDGLPVGSNPAMSLSPLQLGKMTEIWIGRSRSDNAPWLDGKVDDFQIYDGALSAEEISALCATQKSETAEP